MKKFVAIGVSLLLALAVVAYVSLGGRPTGPGDPSVVVPAEERETSGDLPEAEAPGAEQRRVTQDALRDSRKMGAVTSFWLEDGDIGYLVVDSIVQDRDPHSAIALLQAHRDLTGADELLELEIRRVRKSPGGMTVSFQQLIEGKPVAGNGYLRVDSGGAVMTVRGKLIDPQGVRADSVVILQAEAEEVAREEIDGYAATLPVIPELREQPLSIEILPAELRQVLDSNNELRAAWRFPVRIRGQKVDSVEVLVSAETGEMIAITSLMIPQPSASNQLY